MFLFAPIAVYSQDDIVPMVNSPAGTIAATTVSINGQTVVFDKSGVCEIINGEKRVVGSIDFYFPPDWQFVNQKSAKILSSDPKLLDTGVYEFSGEILVPNTSNSMVYTQIVRQEDNNMNFEISIENKGADVEIWNTYYTFELPNKSVAGKKIIINGAEVFLPEKISENVNIVNEIVSDKLVLPLSVQIDTQEEQRWNIYYDKTNKPDNFLVRLVMGEKQFLKSGDKMNASFTLVFISESESKSDSQGKELLKNSDFAQGLESWSLSQSGYANAQARVTSEGPDGISAVCIEVSKTGTQGLQVRFSQSSINVQSKQFHILKFWAKSERPGAIYVYINQSGKGFSYVGFNEIVTMTSQWRQYQYKILLTEDNVTITFGLGLQLGATWFAGISLQVVE